MAFHIPETGGGNDFEPLSSGLHYGRCYAIVDAGVQKEHYNGETKEQHKVAFGFEFPDEMLTYTRDGQEVTAPKILWATYTLSLHEKARLRKFIENWVGKPFTEESVKTFDLEKLLGRPGQFSIAQYNDKKGKLRAKINNDVVIPCTADQVARAKGEKTHNAILLYKTEEPQVNYTKLPKWLKEMVDARVIRGAPKTASQTKAQEEFDDDIPF
jgi:hypothetical protein